MKLQGIADKGLARIAQVLDNNENEKKSSEFLNLTYGMPAEPERLKMLAEEYGVKIVKEREYPLISEPQGLVQIHVQLPNGEYGFFTPGGPKGNRDYSWTPSVAKNYE